MDDPLDGGPGGGHEGGDTDADGRGVEGVSGGGAAEVAEADGVGGPQGLGETGADQVLAQRVVQHPAGQGPGDPPAGQEPHGDHEGHAVAPDPPGRPRECRPAARAAQHPGPDGTAEAPRGQVHQDVAEEGAAGDDDQDERERDAPLGGEDAGGDQECGVGDQRRQRGQRQ
ncbi:hypothetical protein SAZ_17185 [Streptomyces noursei ZPM]|nr:hypothetical protein SAZ_17185 [Streptomyces noursei ZPM]